MEKIVVSLPYMEIASDEKLVYLDKEFNMDSQDWEITFEIIKDEGYIPFRMPPGAR